LAQSASSTNRPTAKLSTSDHLTITASADRSLPRKCRVGHAALPMERSRNRNAAWATQRYPWNGPATEMPRGPRSATHERSRNQMPREPRSATCSLIPRFSSHPTDKANLLQFHRVPLESGYGGYTRLFRDMHQHYAIDDQRIHVATECPKTEPNNVSNSESL